MGQKKKKTAAGSSQGGLPVVSILAGVATLAIVVAGIMVARKGAVASPAQPQSPQPSGDPNILFSAEGASPSSYPNVTGKRLILDYGVTEPRPIDGPIPFAIAGTVPVEDWHGRKDNIAQVNIDRGTPVIMRRSVVSRWKAMKKWSPEFFRTSVPVWQNISRAKRLRRAFINFEPNTPMEKVTPWEFWENAESREEYPMSMAEWFERASNASDGVSWFFAEEVPKVLHRDLLPRHQLKLPDQSWVYFGIWMGEGGATTAAHWDMDDNFYVQFFGRKRFLLFPPSHYKRWKSYPRASPNHKQVQMRRDDPSRYAYRLADSAAGPPVAIEAILEPGDMLYIPAYWYHHVEAMVSPPGTSPTGDPSAETEHISISANFWSTKSVPFLTSIQEPQPFDEEFSAENAAAIRGLFPDGYPAKDVPLVSRMILASVIANRLFASNSLAAIARQTCWLRYVDLFGPAPVSTAACPPPLDAEERQVLEDALEPFAQAHLDGLRDIDPAASETEFMNFLELSIEEMVPTAQLYSTLYNCIAHTLRLNPKASTGFGK